MPVRESSEYSETRSLWLSTLFKGITYGGTDMTEKIPRCCDDCFRLGFEFIEEDREYFYYCKIGVALPVKKGTCKRRE